MTAVLIRRENTHRENATRMTIGAEITVMHLQAKDTKDCQQLPEAMRARKDSPIQPSERALPCQHLDFRLLASRTVRE